MTFDAPIPAEWVTHSNGTGPAFRREGDTLRADRRSGRVASYLLGPPAASFGATFTLEPQSRRFLRDDGGVMLGVWSAPFQERERGSLPDSPCHLMMTPTHWVYGVAHRGTIATVRRGLFARRLRGEVSAAVAIGNGSAEILLPNLRRVRVEHPRIQRADARQVCFEVYQEDASTDAQAGLRSAWYAP